MNRNARQVVGQIVGMIDGQQVVGLDIAKSVFQMHTIDMQTGEIINTQLKRAKVLEHFANRAPCLIGIEACGSAHHWARQLTALGHNVRLIHAKVVRPFVSGNKTDVTDARAIWQAVQQPGTRFVGIKTLAQQATLILHRQRALLMKAKIGQVNVLRGLLYELGATFARGRNALLGDLEAALGKLNDAVGQDVLESLREQAQHIRHLEARIKVLDQRLTQRARADTDMKRVLAVPGVGVLTASAAIATMGQARAFASGREFAAWLGLVKRGDSYLRTLLIHGARAVLTHSKEPGTWLENLKSRRPTNVAIVAQAAKTARTIWALTAKEQDYQRGYQSVRPTVSLQTA